MSDITTKVAYRIFYLVKGHLGVTEETARACYDGYFKRCWYNQEAWTREDAFEDAWQNQKNKIGN